MTRYVPREIVVFPHDPFDSAAIAEWLRGDGFIVLGTAPMSGMILAATAANVPGLEELMCEYVARWPEVRETGRNPAGEVLGRQPTVCVETMSLTPGHCSLPYPTGQVPNCGTPLSGQPDDNAFCYQWGLHNTGQTVTDMTWWTAATYPNGCWIQEATPGIDINLLPAWERTTGSPLVTVAVLDSGIEYCNPDFDDERFLYPDIAITCEGNDTSAYPCCTSSPPFACDYGEARDNQGHGTYVASIIGAVADNNLGIAGIDQQCKLLAARVFTMNETAMTPEQRYLANAARAVIALESIALFEVYESVRVINISFAIPMNAYPDEPTTTALETAIYDLAVQNRFVVTGAGNAFYNTADGYTPARAGYAITVGAIDSQGRRVQHEDSAASGSSSGYCLDFVAPGMAEPMLICQAPLCDPAITPTACPYYMYGCVNGDFYNNFRWGTSYAAPKVAAAISLILAHAIDLGIVCPDDWSGLSWADMYEILKAGARDELTSDSCDIDGWDPCYGWGLIDVDASLEYLENNFAPQNPPC